MVYGATAVASHHPTTIVDPQMRGWRMGQGYRWWPDAAHDVAASSACAGAVIVDRSTADHGAARWRAARRIARSTASTRAVLWELLGIASVRGAIGNASDRRA
jgi:hypothetical protein